MPQAQGKQQHQQRLAYCLCSAGCATIAQSAAKLKLSAYPHRPPRVLGMHAKYAELHSRPCKSGTCTWHTQQTSKAFPLLFHTPYTHTQHHAQHTKAASTRPVSHESCTARTYTSIQGPRNVDATFRTLSYNPYTITWPAAEPCSSSAVAARAGPHTLKMPGPPRDMHCECSAHQAMARQPYPCQNPDPANCPQVAQET